MAVLLYTNCDCGSMYLVGINEKDIRNIPSSGKGFFAIGHKEMDAIDKKIHKGDKIPCPGCTKECVVKQSGGVFDEG